MPDCRRDLCGSFGRSADCGGGCCDCPGICLRCGSAVRIQSADTEQGRWFKAERLPARISGGGIFASPVPGGAVAGPAGSRGRSCRAACPACPRIRYFGPGGLRWALQRPAVRRPGTAAACVAARSRLRLVHPAAGCELSGDLMSLDSTRPCHEIAPSWCTRWFQDVLFAGSALAAEQQLNTPLEQVDPDFWGEA